MLLEHLPPTCEDTVPSILRFIRKPWLLSSHADAATHALAASVSIMEGLDPSHMRTTLKNKQAVNGQTQCWSAFAQPSRTLLFSLIALPGLRQLFS